MDAKPGRAAEGAREIALHDFGSVPTRVDERARGNACQNYFVFWITGIYPAYSKDILRGPETQIVHVIGDIKPPVDHSRRDDDNVARFHFDFFHAIGHAGAGWSVWPTRIVILVAVASIHDVAIGERRSAAGDDVIALGLEIVNDAPWRSAGRKGGHLAPTGFGRRCRGGCVGGGRRRRRIPSGGAMNHADREILVSSDQLPLVF